MCLLIHTRITRESNKPWRPRKVRLIKQIFDIRIYSWGSEFEFELAMIGESGKYLDDLICRWLSGYSTAERTETSLEPRCSQPRSVSVPSREIMSGRCSQR
jgi:hypothetical protein